ncbi:MAG: hypothetical protein ACJA1C_002158 [Crocinitomicaceae bacterium]|jgi:hypothetical protein
MKLFLLSTTLLFTSFLYSQTPEYEKKTNKVKLDDVHLFDLIRTCDNGQNCRFEIFDLSGKKIIRINHRSFKSLVEKTDTNPDGTVRYLEFIFLESGQKAEYDSSVIKQKRVAKLVVTNNLIKDGVLNEEAMNEFILVNGTPFSERIKL